MSLNAMWAMTVAVADTDGAKRLYDLMVAIDPTVPTQVSKIRVQADVANGANPVRLGDSQVSATRCGCELLTHDQVPYEHPVASGMPWLELYVFNPTAGSTVKAHVEVWLI